MPAKQSGVVLLIFILVILMSFGTYVLSGLSINQVKNDQKKQTQAVLRDAKVAIIAHAVTHMDQAGGVGEMGYLPCPNKNSAPEGGSAGNCDEAKKNSFGYYPWASLETDVLTDNSGSCLRYVVSGSYKNSPHSGMINEDSNGQLQVVDAAGTVTVGNAPEGRLIAIILAPGDPLAGQERTMDVDYFCGNDYGNMAAYLDGNGVTDNGTLSGVADDVDQFIHASDSSATEAEPYNDQFIAITRDEIWSSIVERPDFVQKMENLTQALAMCLAEYANLAENTSRRLPWPVKTDVGLSDYRDNLNYQDDAPTVDHGYSGRFPFDVASSNVAIAGAFSSTNLFDAASCSALSLIDSGAGVVADLKNDSEYRRLWNNWKDHFFYVLSKKYEPGNTGKKKCAPPGPNDCIKVATGERRAGAVIFSGRRLDGVTRNDKSAVADYLEDGKAAVFAKEATDKKGNEKYDNNDQLTNDIIYCIRNRPIGQPLDVEKCE